MEIAPVATKAKLWDHMTNVIVPHGIMEYQMSAEPNDHLFQITLTYLDRTPKEEVFGIFIRAAQVAKWGRGWGEISRENKKQPRGSLTL